jgi:alkylhydroperoxidase/carboxymuconolactone decarboxylase family protein YurZ
MSRAAARKQGKQIAAALGLDATRSPVPGLDDLLAEAVYAGIWGRPQLAHAERAICTLAVLSALQRLPALKSMVATALRLSLTPRNIVEVFVQAGLYAGFVTTDASVAVAQEVFQAGGLSLALEAQSDASTEALDRKGREVMAQLHGARAEEGYAAPGNSVTAALYPMAIRYGYGELWSRPGLNHRQRLLCALAAFTALGLEGQLRKFAKSAGNLGLTREEVIEAVIQTAPYGGFPRALNGLAVISDVLTDGLK